MTAPQFECNVCGRTWATEQDVIRIAEISLRDDEPNRFWCPACGTEFLPGGGTPVQHWLGGIEDGREEILAAIFTQLVELTRASGTAPYTLYHDAMWLDRHVPADWAIDDRWVDTPFTFYYRLAPDSTDLSTDLAQFGQNEKVYRLIIVGNGTGSWYLKIDALWAQEGAAR